MTARICLVALLTLLGTALAEADPRPDLRVHSLPLPAPTTLGIRGNSDTATLRTAAADDSKRKPEANDEEDDDEGNPFELQQRLRKRLRESDLVGQQRTLDEKVVFRFNIGFGLDDGKPDCSRNVDPCLDAGTDAQLNSRATLGEAEYDRLRNYTFGDLVAGTRGLLFESLSSYFAAGFRFDYTSPVSSAIPTVHDGSGVDTLLIRSAYGEAEGDKFFDNKWLKPLSIKAGRMYQYGAGVMHMDGVDIVYETGPLKLYTWAGQRVYNYAPDFTEAENLVQGAGLVLDFYKWRKWPLVLFSNGMQFDGVDFGDQGLAIQFSRDISLRASVRNVRDQAARQTLTLRARVSEVATVFAEVDNRTEHDWVYDMLVRDPIGGQIVDVRDYLNLGEPLPRTLLRLRAGTVLFDAIDVLVSGAVAVEHAARDVDNSAFSSSFFEGGAAFDFRVRRAIRVGGSFDARVYKRDDVLLDEEPNDGTIGRLLDETGSFGERSYVQAGGRIQYSTGARGFTSNAELFGRVYDHQSPYFLSDELDNEARVGGRFTIQAFVAEKLRLKAIYDVSGELEYAPEITGIKSLRVMMEGTF